MPEIPNGSGIATFHLSQAEGMPDITFTHGLHWGPSSDSPDEVAETIYSYFVTGATPFYSDNMLVGWTFLGVSILARDAGGDLLAGTHYDSVAGDATATDELVPAYSPLVITKRTGFAGVQYRGRMYPPATGFYASTLSPLGEIDSAEMPAQQDRWGAAFTLWAANPQNYPVLLHSPPETGPTPLPTQVTSWQVQSTIGIQRRRKN